ARNSDPQLAPHGVTRATLEFPCSSRWRSSPARTIDHHRVDSDRPCESAARRQHAGAALAPQRRAAVRVGHARTTDLLGAVAGIDDAGLVTAVAAGLAALIRRRRRALVG